MHKKVKEAETVLDQALFLFGAVRDAYHNLPKDGHRFVRKAPILNLSDDLISCSSMFSSTNV